MRAGVAASGAGSEASPWRFRRADEAFGGADLGGAGALGLRLGVEVVDFDFLAIVTASPGLFRRKTGGCRRWALAGSHSALRDW